MAKTQNQMKGNVTIHPVAAPELERFLTVWSVEQIVGKRTPLDISEIANG
jgi:hypothetical protein